jgi:hypothetical protein
MAAEVPLVNIGQTVPLARGGLGSVEEVRSDYVAGESLVLKRFHRPELVDGAALRRLVGWRRRLPHPERARLDAVAAWPLAVVSQAGELAGFLMQRVPPDFVATVRLPSGRRQRVLREAQYLVADGERARRLRVPEAHVRDRLEVVWALCEVVGFLHRNRIVLGDLSTRNVLWCSAPGRILLVDCDSVTLGGVGSPVSPAFTVDWDDPAQPDVAAASSDVYKLGLFVLRSLGRSFQTRDPAEADAALDGTGRWLLRLSLDADPGARPHADAWDRWAAGRRATRWAGAAR